MISLTEFDYFSQRELQERAMTNAAHHPAAADIHRQLADRYVILANDAAPSLAPRAPLVFRRADPDRKTGSG